MGQGHLGRLSDGDGEVEDGLKDGIGSFGKFLIGMRRWGIG